MGVRGQPVVAVDEGHEGEGFREAGELQLLKDGFDTVDGSSYRLSGTGSARLTSSKGGGREDATHGYQILAVLLVDGDHAALGGALLAGLLDADVGDVGKVAQQLQLLRTGSSTFRSQKAGAAGRRDDAPPGRESERASEPLTSSESLNFSRHHWTPLSAATRMTSGPRDASRTWKVSV